ncbi:MAG: ribonuclease III [Burkholderiales bacterium]
MTRSAQGTAPRGRPLAESLGHAFAEPALLAQALTHRSHGAHHNERFEFIGDAVLNCVVAELLFTRFPQMTEGELSRARAGLVNRDMLARIAVALDLGAEIKLGEGEVKSGGATRPSILADALEAVFGAVFVDAGYDAARRVIHAAFGDVLDDPIGTVLAKDPKTSLQEWLQGRRLPVPEYAVVAVGGEAHAQTFAVECRIAALSVVARGAGMSRRAAEQDAAQAALAAVRAANATSR